MKRIDMLFNLHRAKSDLFSKYNPGKIPYVGNGLSDNAVLGLVAALPGDKIFNFKGIAVSAFCEASVQMPPFVGCGRAGNGITVLEPKEPMTVGQLAYFASYLNLGVRWRFSWYWQTTVDRLGRLMVPDSAPKDIPFRVQAYLPKMSRPTATTSSLRMRRFALGDLFDLKAGDFHSVGHLPAGDIPVISCGDLDNGVCGYFKIEKSIYERRMTIAFNGSTLSAKFHPYKFAAKDDVAVCSPKSAMRLTTMSLIQVMLARERWRFSYYRKCFKDKLARTTVPLPETTDGRVDEDAIEAIIRTTPYAGFLHDQLT